MLIWQRYRVLPDGPCFAGLDAPGRAGMEAPGGHMAARAAWVLFHPPEISLRPGDRVERMADGLRLRITGDSSMGASPAGASLRLCRVCAERLVIPC